MPSLTGGRLSCRSNTTSRIGALLGIGIWHNLAGYEGGLCIFPSLFNRLWIFTSKSKRNSTLIEQVRACAMAQCSDLLSMLDVNQENWTYSDEPMPPSSMESMSIEATRNETHWSTTSWQQCRLFLRSSLPWCSWLFGYASLVKNENFLFYAGRRRRGTEVFDACLEK